ncbi:protein FAM47E [Chanos chanos]|uniref:Protein FAM47E n=1 Tax=Chanos chanos TaxID=29144 RepID=A0A6J2WTS7_CHACN|nr:protein FAM47E [Chanos chanos]
MSPELFDEVLSVLDPDMCIKSEETLPQKPHEEGPLPCESITEQSAAESERLSLHTTIEQDSLKTCSQKNPFILKENGGKSAKDDQIDEVDSLYEDEDLKKVTRLFCEWAASLGGEDNLTESKILGMFTSGHERKPPLSFPIEVVEPNQIPPELRSSTEDMSSTLPCSSKEAESEKVHRSTKKMKYGVWYLDPKTWKEARDPLRDDAEEVGGKLSDKDEELKQMYGTQAFKTFLTNKGLRWPGFLRSLFPEEEEVKRARKNDTAGSASTHKDTVVL